VDVYELLARPQRQTGAGRRIVLDQPVTLRDLAERVKKHLGITMVKMAAAPGAPRAVTHIGVCAGSGSDLAPLARADGCEVYITGEMTHHEALAELHKGMSVLLAGHTNTERGYLPRLARRLNEALPGLKAVVSRADKSPFEPV
jgi:putative NIF3 family GTP cyclohydrolase 1 type 2